MCMYVCMCMYIYIYVYVCIYICVCMYVCIYMYACMHACMYVYGALNAEDRQAIEQHRASCQQTPAHNVRHRVCVEARKAFDRDSMKMFFSVHRDAEQSFAALKGLIHAGGKLKRGQAPRSGREREVQEVVDHLPEILGGK